ncbi:MAG: glycosyltransferase family 39 protein, partial [Stellaceae bacterium]
MLSKHHLVPAVIIIFAALVMFFHLGQKSLWNDEAFSFFVSRNGPINAANFISQDTQPPLYYAILGIWLKIGKGAFALRALSALALVLAVLPLYGAAVRLFDRRVATVAALLFVLSPLVVDWAQKARPYAVQTSLLSFAFWGFIEVYCSPVTRRDWIGQSLFSTLRTRTLRPLRTDLGWAALVGGGGFAMLAQDPAGFFLLGMNVAVLIDVLPRLRSNIRWLSNWAISQLLLLGIWMLWLPTFLSQFNANLTPAQIALRHTNFLIGSSELIANLIQIFGIASVWHAEPVFLALMLTAALIGTTLLIR